MRVTISTFRQDLFKLVDRALAGEPIEFTHKGVVFRILPESRPSKLERLTPRQVVAPDADLGQASRELLREMESEWEKDWSEL